MLLGDFYAGLLPTSPLTLNLTLAFSYYQRSVKSNFADFGRAHYMLAFIAQYHPEATPDSYHKQIATAETTIGVLDETERKEEIAAIPGGDDAAVVPQPNVPTVILHLAMGARAGSSYAKRRATLT